MSKKIVIALGGNALGSTLHEQADAVQITAKAIVDLIAAGHQVIVAHGNGPQVGIINNAMLALMHEDPTQDSTPLSVCGAMSQAYIGYDLQNALREEMLNRGIDEPVVTMVTQVEVDPKDPAFKDPSKPIGKFLSEEEAKAMAAKTGFLFKEDAGRGWRRYVASPKPQQIVELGAIRALSDDGNIVICCGGGGIPVYRTERNHLKGAAAVIDKDFASELLAEQLDADMLIILTAVMAVVLRKTTFGWHVYAVGGNERAARMSGIKTDRNKIYVYMISGVCAALVGMINTAQLMAAHPASGDGWEMNAIAASVLGGTSMAGGIGTIGGTFVGAFVIGVLNDGMTMCGVSEFWQKVIKGAVIILAVVIDQYQRNLQAKMALRVKNEAK